MPSSPSISVVLVRPLAEALRPSPEALSAFYRATDLTDGILADADARVSPAQFCVAWSDAIRLTGEPSLALALAAQIPTGAFGVVEYVCRASATLRDAFTQWIRYLSILDDAVRVGLVDEGDESVLRVVRESDAPAPASHELCFALLVRHARSLVHEPVRIRSVHFTHRVSDSHLRALAGFFASPIVPGARTTEIRFDRASLDAPLVTADPALLSVLLPVAEERSARRTDDPPLTDHIRRTLRSALSQSEAQLEVVARRVGMTPRSLQRRLKDEGTTFNALVEATRRELADRYIGQGLSLAEVSFLLGFSEPSAFFRAFKRWTGSTPLERRNRLLQVLPT